MKARQNLNKLYSLLINGEWVEDTEGIKKYKEDIYENLNKEKEKGRPKLDRIEFISLIDKQKEWFKMDFCEEEFFRLLSKWRERRLDCFQMVVYNKYWWEWKEDKYKKMLSLPMNFLIP